MKKHGTAAAAGLVALALLGWGAWGGWREMRHSSWNAAEGTVVALEPAGGRREAPIVEYALGPKGPARHRGERNTRGAYSVGQKLPLRVDPHTGEAVIDAMPDRWITPIAASFFGIVFGAIALVSWRRQ